MKQKPVSPQDAPLLSIGSIKTSREIKNIMVFKYTFKKV